MALLAGLSPASAACVPAGAELTGWWPADHHTFNVVNQRAALSQGAVTYVPGVAGDAFRFDGAGKVRITEAAALDLSRTNRWTITAWVNPSTLEGAATPVIYSEGNRVAALGIQKSTGQLLSWINGGNLLESTTSLDAGVWTHVALVLDRTTRTLYVNGAAAGTATGTPATTADSTGSMIGGVTADDSTAAFDGAIDELTLHRRALSADEIAALYAAGGDGFCFGEGAPAWVIEPQPQTAPLFGDATFTGLAMGSPRPTYQWFFNDAPLAGQTGFTLALTGVTTANDGVYKLVATSGAQSTSAEARLTVQHCVTTPPGLVAWWPGDGSALDVTGNHSGGLWFGAGFAGGLAGQAFHFDGASGYVAVPDSPALSPHAGAAGEMTVEAWVYLSRMPQRDLVLQENARVVLAKGDPGRWEYLLRISTTGVVVFNPVNPPGTLSYGIASGGQIVLNRWHHLVGTVKKGQYVRLYQDGQLMAEDTTLDGDTADTGAPFLIGRRSEGGFLDGLVDEVAVYDRALTSEQVRALYAGGSVGKCYDGGPVPVFVQEPRDKEGYLLNSVTLEGLALGTPRPTYQWYHEGAAVAGATNASLTLSDLSPAAGGPYYLVASNQFGVAQSRNLTLTLVDWATVKHGFELEGDWKEWREWSTDDHSIWQIGPVASGPGGAHSGTSCAATVSAGNYPDDRGARLVSPAFTVPAALEKPRLRFWHWWSFNRDDGGQVQISTNNGASWQPLSPTYRTDSSGRWTRAWLDLKTYAGQTVRLGFYFSSYNFTGSPDVAPGWYIDEVEVETGEVPPMNWPESFEDAVASDRWTADFGVWELGVPTSGPGITLSGNRCLATILSGDYTEDRNSLVQSQPFVVPPAGDNPRLRFWHWWSFNSNDGGRVQISTNDGQSWQTLTPTYGANSSGRWTRAWLDLKAYAGQTVRLGFYFSSYNFTGSPDVAPGWYIDEVEVETGEVPPMNWPESFEDAVASDRWTADFGVWELGVPTSGPGITLSGNRCLATILSGDYTEDRNSLVQSQPFVVPPAEGGPRLCFWHWWSFNKNDGGRVQISTNNGESWQPLSATYGADSGGRWTRTCFDLQAYSGQTVRLGFYFSSYNFTGSPDVAPGWYIDDLMIQVGNIGLAEVPSQTVNEKTPVSFKASAVGANANSSLVFTLPWAPAGAWIDPESGNFTWVPGERQGPGVYRIPFYVVDYGNNEANEMTLVTITVNEVNERPWLLPASLAVEPGQTLHFPLFAGDRDFPKNPLGFSMTGAPAGLTLTTNSGILHWAVPLTAPAATHRLNVTLRDNGSPNYTTNNTITVTVTSDAVFGLGVRHLGGTDFEFTIHDAVVGQDYILQRTSAIVDSATWLANGDVVPAWVATLPEEDFLEWLSWEDFVQARLQRTEWADVVRVSPAGLPHSFVLAVTDVPEEPIGLFRLVRVQR
jgi:hypothetical protein